MHVTSNTEEWVLDGSCCNRHSSLCCFFYALQQRQCLMGYSHIVTVKWISEKSIIIYIPVCLFHCTCVSLCAVADRSGMYSMNPRGALPRSVSDESPGRWQGVITERKTPRYKKNLEEIKKIDASPAGTRGKTCQWLHHLLGLLSFLLSLLSITFSWLPSISASPLLLHFFLSSLHPWHLH